MLITMGLGSTLFVLSLLYSLVRVVEWYRSEAIIGYTIAVPNPPGDGTLLEKPSIKVRVVKTSGGDSEV